MADSVVGRAYWELRAEDDRLKSDLRTAETQVRASGRRSADAYSGEWKRGSQGVVGHLNSVKGALAGIGIGLGLTAAIGALGDMVTAAREETVAIAAMNTALEANDKAWDGNTESIEGVIEARMALGFTDDEQRASLAKLVAITRDSTEALDLQRVAMDLSRLRGMDLGAASELLGKVYAGNVGILKRYGIALEEGATATEAIAAIQRQASGQAEAWADTEAGAAATAQIALEELGEDIGKELLPVITELAVFTRDTLVPALRSLVDVGKELGPVFEGLSIAATLNIDAIRGKFDDFGAAVRYAEAEAKGGFEGMVRGFGHAREEILATAEVLADDLPETFEARQERMRRGGYDSMVAYAAGLLDAQDKPRVALDALNLAMNTALTRGEEIARLRGQLASTHLAAGLDDERPAVRAAAVAARQAIIDQLASLGVGASGWGRSVGSNLAAGLWSTIPDVEKAVRAMGYTIAGPLRLDSEPKDHTSPLYGHMKWGVTFGKDIARGLAQSTPRVGGAARYMAGAMAGAFGTAPAVGTRGVAGGGGAALGGVTVNFTYSPGMSTASPGEIENLRRQITGIVVDGLARSGLAERPPGRF